jgi:hypothetical protein
LCGDFANYFAEERCLGGDGWGTTTERNQVKVVKHVMSQKAMVLRRILVGGGSLGPAGGSIPSYVIMLVHEMNDRSHGCCECIGFEMYWF